MSDAPLNLHLPDLDADVLRNLCGADNRVLKRLEGEFGVTLSGQAGAWQVEGARAAEAVAAMQALLAWARRGPLEDVQVEGILRHGRNEMHQAAESAEGGNVIVAGRRRIQGKTPNQRKYLESIQSHVLTIGVGPAGTGKTYLAVAAAVAAIESHQVERMILTRPAVEAGERLGFLPGDLQQKVDPYLRPLFDALADMIGLEKMAAMMETGRIEVAPLAYMRGRTLNDAFVILDEAQNTTREQMKMFLTRLGFSSRMVVTGDTTQVDLPAKQHSGLLHALKVLEGVNDVALCRLQGRDVVRHKLVEDIVAAYERSEAGE
ncbi:MAG: phosphate starvation-inducible protein PhoH [Zetaproteobacteria bacterium CG12_big_fil_rev_8_21_14_0_65_55_1124]|nr:MAG: phosphate starvation-inducible protein PhoH [Zetaproteobacteria bacterium CG1_02_55_237]PIS19508.1 MAG: phosphate starvation-inducible protein PhoH [Zetaproteobacteria bacterium CG08_land_8_20_14_0_20_55_17]PIW42390.1 MAG: phosphate starvation-inducible protein PhoH [Zetaproteobacteria bacterium CG12_big_fil_rev_8_21_14_0_65_55_1124]PIY52808.1 MAG: phosphate starvation-inducible protein PhoH [Zetaproteobacteria bacterium CG_4_10_14_0_8_um_filter_55_43]PIZ38014.1 MAG: phosphate starvatio